MTPPTARLPAFPSPRHETCSARSTLPTSWASAIGALLGTLAYTGARVGAVARLRRGDLEDQGPQRVLRFREKGGKQQEIPVRHDLDRWLGEYLEAAGIEDAPKETPLFRSALGKQKQLSPRPLSANSMGLMLKRRLKDAGLAPIFSPHSFRVLVVTGPALPGRAA